MEAAKIKVFGLLFAVSAVLVAFGLAGSFSRLTFAMFCMCATASGIETIGNLPGFIRQRRAARAAGQKVS